MFVKYTLETGTKPTMEQLKEIEDAAKRPIVFDNDCEELSKTVIEAFREKKKRLSQHARLTWDEIIQQYPEQQVGLIDIEYINGPGVVIKSAVVACTEKDTGRNRMAFLAINGELQVHYTTDKDVVIIKEKGDKVK